MNANGKEAGGSGNAAVKENDEVPKTNVRSSLGEGRREQGVDAESQRKTVDFFLVTL